MVKLTDKEFSFFMEYVKDLLEVLLQENDVEICDNCYRYTIDEILDIQKKLSCMSKI